MQRRHFLRGAGALLTLPALEAFAVKKAVEPPLRLVFMGFPWGVTRNNWFPENTGKDFQITKGLQPLSEHKDDLTIFKNLTSAQLPQRPQYAGIFPYRGGSQKAEGWSL